MKVLISGGAGFGGAGLTRRLVEKGHDVTVLDITAPRHATLIGDLYEERLIHYNWKSTLDLVPGDLQGFDLIFDFAAQADAPLGFSSPFHTAHNNILSVYRLMECLKRYPPQKFVYMGSGTTFGPNQPLPIPENAPQYATNPYSASKHCAEIVVMAYHRTYDIPVTIIRNGIVYGEHMRRETVIAQFIIQALQGKSLIIEGGDQTRDLTYIADTLDALQLVISADPQEITGEIFHCATGIETSIRRLAELVLQLTKSASSIVRVPYRRGEQNIRQCLDCSKAQRILGYKSKIFLEEGLKRAILWFSSQLETLEKAQFPMLAQKYV